MMAIQITKTVTKTLLSSCRHRSINMCWTHSSIMSTQLVSTLLGKHLQIRRSLLLKYSHLTAIPLPSNVKDINAIETARFSPQRNRDITSDMISAQSSEVAATPYVSGQSCPENVQSIDSYDCTGTVSLNSAMQTNVPQPFTTKQKSPVHLNMPGGEWSRSDKYIAEDMQNAFSQNHQETGYIINADKGIYTFQFMQNQELLNRVHWWSGSQKRLFSTFPSQGDKNIKLPGDNNGKPSLRVKLLRAAKEYGSTVLVFHTSISLLSLGICYLAVTSGLDLKWLQSYLPVEVPEEVGAFVIAYAVHKTMAPARVSITLVSTPIIVRYLRKKGFLKPPVINKYYQKASSQKGI